MSRFFLKWFRVFLTLAVAAAIGLALWQRLGPRLEKLPDSALRAKPFDAAFIRLSPREIASLPEAARFDHPLGSPNAALTYNAQPFRVTRHLGDDLNGIGGMDSDRGDAVHAAATGRVVYAGVPGPGWGNMVIIAHRVPESGQTGGHRIFQTVYAHLEQILVRSEQVVSRGEVIGTVGTAIGENGRPYPTHLHFEVRQGPYVNPGVGYADAPLNRVSPERFIAEHRGAPDDLLNPPPREETGEVGVEANVK